MLAINATSLYKSFSPKTSPAVNDLSIAIKPGEAVAFLGPNGAGKSTTIKMLCGILKPDSGNVEILGFPSGSKAANIRLGLVFGARSQLFFHMKVSQCLDLQAETYYVTGKLKCDRIAELSELFGCQPLLEKRVRELSLGERMRCEIVASLLHQPSVILLDEPTIGLDIIAKHRLRESLREWQSKANTTMLLTSHDLSDVEALCDRCILINKGVKAYDGSIKQVRGQLEKIRRIKLILSQNVNSPHPIPHGIKETPSENQFEKSFEFSLAEISLSQTMTYLTQSFGPHLEDIQILGVQLEEVIQKLYAQQ